MRKIYTMAVALLMGIGSLSAQTMIISIDGKEVKDGDNIEITKQPKETAVGPLTLYDLGVEVEFRTNIAQTVHTEGIDLNQEAPGLACCPTGFSCTTASGSNNWVSAGTMADLAAGREVNGEWIHYNYNRTKPAEGTTRKSIITFKGDSETISFHLTIKVGDPSGVDDVASNAREDGKVYNLAGQRVADHTPGLVIKNGKKYIRK